VSEISYQLVNFFGAPGSGKGTQVFKLAENYPFKIVGMSSMIKSFIATHDNPNSSEYERVGRIKQKFASGDLVDFEDVKVVIQKDITASLERGEKLLLEGFPRNTDQARWFAGILESHNIKTMFVHLSIELDVILERIKHRFWIEGNEMPFASYNEALKACKPGQEPFQRGLDIDEDIIKKRFAVQYTDFKDEILEIMQNCKAVTVQTIQANQTPKKVCQDILDQLIS